MGGLLTVVLAAGKGTRMNSDLNKVLHRLGGRPMITHIIDTLTELDSEMVCVVGHQGQRVKQVLDTPGLNFVEQTQQLGTGHAVLQARDYIRDHQGPVLIVYADTPLLRPETLEDMVNYHQQQEAGVTVLTARLEQPGSYGRIKRDQDDLIKEIVEAGDASPEEKQIREINTGVYCFDSNWLDQALDSLEPDNAQGEYYLTDTLSYIYRHQGRVVPRIIEDTEEVMGINDRQALARAEKVIRQRINNFHMDNGVTIIDPETTYIDRQVKIGRDTIIYPFTWIEGETRIGKNTVVGPHNRLINSEIGDEVNLKSSCVIRESTIKNECNIGPFAHIRPGTFIEDQAKVGDFVELKKASVDRGSKVPHLSYVGDAEIGKETNIGAGTIFANYDGVNKHKTSVGDSVFIGSNTTLIAPVKVGDGGKTGAGAVVTRDIPENTTVIGVPARIYKKDKGKNES